MSKSLNTKIIKEIEQRETARIKEEIEKERDKNDNTKVTIMSFLDTEFSNCLGILLILVEKYIIKNFFLRYGLVFMPDSTKITLKLEEKNN